MAQFEGTQLILLLFAVNITGGFIFGYNTGIIATAMDPLKDDNLGGGFADSSVQQGVMTVSILVGAMIASAFGGSVADIMGRRYATILLGVLTVVGALGSAITSWLWVIILFRELLGLGVGFSSAVCPVYVSEMAPPERKGQLGASFQMAVTVGILVSYVVGAILQNVQYNWHWMFGIGAIPGAVIIGIGMVMPESLGRAGTDLDQPTESSDGFMLLLGPYRKQLLIGLLLATTLQLTGINAIMYYAPEIFKQAGLDGENASIYAGIAVSAWNFLATFGALFLVDRLGRRPLLLGGLAVMAVCDLVVGVLYLFFTGTAGSVASLFFVFGFVGGFEFGIGSLFWPLLTEIYPEEVRGAGATVMNLVQWTFNVLLSMLFLPLVDLLQLYTLFFLFSVVGIGCFVAIFLILPETKSRV